MARSQEGASDVIIEFLELSGGQGTFDLKEKFQALNIYENIYRSNVTCDIVINDSINLPLKTPILGEEDLNFSITSKSVVGNENHLTGPMYITNISKRTFIKDRQQLFILHGTSETDMTNQNTRVCQTFRNKKISEIVETILDEWVISDNDHVIEDTVGTENIVIPNWTPNAACHWLARRALNENNVPNYLFFESNNITYFKSVDSFMSTPVKQNFVYSPTQSKDEKILKLMQGYQQLDKLEILHQFDVKDNINNGYYASKLITHDIIKKKINQHTFGLNEAYAEGITHADKYMPISKSVTYFEVPDRNTYAPQDTGSINEGDSIQSYFDSKVMFHPKHDKMYSTKTNDAYDNNVENWMLQRNTLLNGLRQIKLQIVMPGLPWLHCGDMIHIAVPSPEKVMESKPGMVKNLEDLNDKYLSGNYMITSMKHAIDFNEGRFKYSIVAEVIKDALGDPPTHH